MKPPAVLLAVDPSIRSLGVALFRNGRLYTSDRLSFKASKADIIERVAATGPAVENWLRKLRMTMIDVLVVEWPQVYRASRAKGNPNNLLPLAGVCGAVTDAVLARQSFSYQPREWAGNTKKKTTVREAKTSPRARWILSCLSGAELHTWERAKYDDEIDAIGLGLHHLGRLPTHRRVFPGATPG